MPHGLQRVQILATLGKQVIEATDKATLVLIVDKVESVVLPCLTHGSQEFLQCHLTLSLGYDVANDSFRRRQVQIPNITKGKGNKREPFPWLESLVDLLPVSLAESGRHIQD